MQPVQAAAAAVGPAGAFLSRPLYLALGWGWAATIVWLSLTPEPPSLDFKESDKLGHFAGYGLLMFWFCLLYLKRRTRIAYAAAFAAMGIGLEFIQGALGYRTFEVFDMYANALGVLLGWAAALALPGAPRILRR